MRNIIFILMISVCVSGTYTVGTKVNLGHQNAEHEICYGSNLDPNGDGVFQLAELNGDLNGGNYYVIALEMSASW
tara:strand:- start:394 stop:618 length:225 start_codon:yes stop_codon:yes gene_type:complete